MIAKIELQIPHSDLVRQLTIHVNPYYERNVGARLKIWSCMKMWVRGRLIKALSGSNSPFVPRKLISRQQDKGKIMSCQEGRGLNKLSESIPEKVMSPHMVAASYGSEMCDENLSDDGKFFDHFVLDSYLELGILSSKAECRKICFLS